jgi:hypothetical protein
VKLSPEMGVRGAKKLSEVLSANHVGGAEPSISTAPRDGREQVTILFRPGVLPQERFARIFGLTIAHRNHLPFGVRYILRKEKETIEETRVCLQLSNIVAEAS